MSDSTTKEEVEAFLKRLIAKVAVWDIFYLDSRPKNVETLAKLEITPNERDQIISSLTVKDYYRGPKPEEFHGGDSEMWEFGRHIKSEEIYIKVTLGKQNRDVI